jgi:hypothetical protein
VEPDHFIRLFEKTLRIEKKKLKPVYEDELERRLMSRKAGKHLEHSISNAGQKSKIEKKHCSKRLRAVINKKITPDLHRGLFSS